MERNPILLFIAERDGASVPDVMHEFGATYSEARSIVDKLIKSGLLEFCGGLIFKPTESGRKEAREYKRRVDEKTAIRELLAVDPGHPERESDTFDPMLEHVRSKWNGIADSMHKPDNGYFPPPKNPFADDDEREDIINADEAEAKVNAVLEEVTKSSLDELEAEAKAREERDAKIKSMLGVKDDDAVGDIIDEMDDDDLRDMFKDVVNIEDLIDGDQILTFEEFVKQMEEEERQEALKRASEKTDDDEDEDEDEDDDEDDDDDSEPSPFDIFFDGDDDEDEFYDDDDDDDDDGDGE